MAHLLIMSTRAYTDLEGGKICCGLITFLLFFTALLFRSADLFAPLDSLESLAA